MGAKRWLRVATEKWYLKVFCRCVYDWGATPSTYPPPPSCPFAAAEPSSIQLQAPAGNGGKRTVANGALDLGRARFHPSAPAAATEVILVESSGAVRKSRSHLPWGMDSPSERRVELNLPVDVPIQCMCSGEGEAGCCGSRQWLPASSADVGPMASELTHA